MTFFIIGGLILLAIIVLLFLASYVKAAPDRAYIISGKRKDPKVLIGKAGLRIPFFDRLDKLNLSLIPIDVRTASEIPTADYINIKVDSNVNIRVGKEPEYLKYASTHFLNWTTDRIATVAREVLEGNMREIVGQMRLEEMVSDRQKFAEMVKDNAAPDLAAMGLEIVSFNVQNFVDANGVIENLGVDNVVRIQKNAAISRAQSERDIAIERAKATQESNDAKAAAEEKIAERNAQLDRKKAELKKDVDTQNAQAKAAEAIEAENQRKSLEIAQTNANIARAEREAELKQREIELEEYRLTAVVRKKADAQKYAAEQEAAADLVRRQRLAEAEAYEAKQQAEAAKAKADADKYAALAEAEAITAKGTAEAEAIEKKAEAMNKMGQASLLEMYFKAFPQAVANAAAPLTNVDSITMYGEGNSSKLIGDVMTSTNQVMAAMEANGIDIKSLLAGLVGGKVAANE